MADVKRAYRQLAMDIHPDHAGPASLQTFLAVKAAYEWIVAHPSFGRSSSALPVVGQPPPRGVPRRPCRPCPAERRLRPRHEATGPADGGTGRASAPARRETERPVTFASGAVSCR